RLTGAASGHVVVIKEQDIPDGFEIADSYGGPEGEGVFDTFVFDTNAPPSTDPMAPGPPQITITLWPSSSWGADDMAKFDADGQRKPVRLTNGKKANEGTPAGDPEWFSVTIAWSKDTTVFVNGRGLDAKDVRKLA